MDTSLDEIEKQLVHPIMTSKLDVSRTYVVMDIPGSNQLHTYDDVTAPLPDH